MGFGKLDNEHAHRGPFDFVRYGLVVTRDWLFSQGVSRATVDNWVRQGHLQSLVPGVLARTETKKLTWQAVVCSLQRMQEDHPLTLGGITALEEQGMGHYLPIGGSARNIHLYGTDKPPRWLNRLAERHLSNTRFVWHGGRGMGEWFVQGGASLRADEGYFLVRVTWREDDLPITMSRPERAVFEILAEVPDGVSFQHADELLRGLPDLSPRRLTALLEKCESVKVRRLFLWFAERHQHPWLRHLALDQYTTGGGKLGSGKRVLAKGGRLDPKYLITVPEEMHGQK